MITAAAAAATTELVAVVAPCRPHHTILTTNYNWHNTNSNANQAGSSISSRIASVTKARLARILAALSMHLSTCPRSTSCLLSTTRPASSRVTSSWKPSPIEMKIFEVSGTNALQYTPGPTSTRLLRDGCLSCIQCSTAADSDLRCPTKITYLRALLSY